MSKKALHILVVAMGSPCYCNIMSKWHLKAKLRNSNNLGFFFQLKKRKRGETHFIKKISWQLYRNLNICFLHLI